MLRQRIALFGRLVQAPLAADDLIARPDGLPEAVNRRMLLPDCPGHVATSPLVYRSRYPTWPENSNMLPFVVQPRRKPIVETIGTEESGQIEIERRGYLTTGEKAFVQQVKQFDDGSDEILTLSRKIARKFSLGMEKAYQSLLKIISSVEAEDQEEQELFDKIELEYADLLTGVVKGLAMGQIKEELVFAACMLRYRVDPNFEIGDVGKLHPDLIQDLAKLYRDEESKSLEAFNASNPEEEPVKISIEEAEKKPVKPSRTRSKSTTGD